MIIVTKIDKNTGEKQIIEVGNNNSLVFVPIGEEYSDDYYCS